MLRFSLISAAAALALAAAVPVAAQDAGSCNYTMKNAFAGPYKVCSAPMSADDCTARGSENDNSDAAHADAGCSAETVVGACSVGDVKTVYYEGDAGGLEIGCGFQGGTWSKE